MNVAGSGIAAEKHKIIFKPFEQGDNSRTRAHGGTGLGLSLARSLVEAHDGTLTVRSELRKGSTFTVLLPLKAKKKEAKTVPFGGPETSVLDAKKSVMPPVNTSSKPKARLERLDSGASQGHTRAPPSRSSSVRQVGVELAVRLRPLA